MSVLLSNRLFYKLVLVFCTLSTSTFATTASSSSASIDDELQALIQTHEIRALTSTSFPYPANKGPLFELGRDLFFSKSLSFNGDVACASCHHPYLAGGDGLSLPIGVDAINPNLLGPGRQLKHELTVKNQPINEISGANVARHSPTIFNIHFYRDNNFWDGRVEYKYGSKGIISPDSIHRTVDKKSGEDLVAAQSRFPIVSVNEMFGSQQTYALSNHQKRNMVMDKFLSAVPAEKGAWQKKFSLAFSDTNITLDRISLALSEYQRSQVLINNPWFAYLQGNKQALSYEQKLGAKLFYTPLNKGGYECSACHSSAFFSDEKFHNLAVPQVGIGKSKTGEDLGRSLVSKVPGDQYKFRTPTLLNVSETGPWGHTGTLLRLYDVIEHHLQPRRFLGNFDFRLKDNLQLKNTQQQSLHSKQLTDKAFLADSFTQQYQAFFDKAGYPESLIEKKIARDKPYLISFLQALTDPCAQDKQCLDQWVAPSSQPLNLLVAEFSQFGVSQPEQVAATQALETIRQGEIIRKGEVIQKDETDKQSNPHNRAMDYLFEDVSRELGFDYLMPETSGNGRDYMSAGVAVDDINGDGWLDVFVSHSVNPGKLFLSQQGQSFRDVSTEYLDDLNSNQYSALFIDLNADRLKDLVMVDSGIGNRFVKVYLNDKGKDFNPTPRQYGLNFLQPANSISAGDVDANGSLELFFTQWSVPNDPRGFNYLWFNQGQSLANKYGLIDAFKTSIDESVLDASLGFTGLLSDVDGDNDLDLLIAGDFSTSQIFSNEEGRFKNQPMALSDENAMGSALGDYDNDGDLDWFVTSIWNPIANKAYIGGETGNRLYRNDGKLSFVEVSEQAGVRQGYWGWGACFADFNNDGWLDIFHTNGMLDNATEGVSIFAQFDRDPSRLFINNQDGTFSEKSQQLGLNHTGQGRGVSCLDFDRDGDIDVLIANFNAAPSLYRNNLLTIEKNEREGNAGNKDDHIRSEVKDKSNANYLTVKLIGQIGNVDAVGAKVILESNLGRQYRELRLGSNYQSNDPVLAHFGLANDQKVHRLTIVWPDGIEQILTSVAVNQYLEVDIKNRQ